MSGNCGTISGVRAAVVVMFLALLPAAAAAGKQGAVRVTLTGQSGAPHAGERWRFAVSAADASGHAVGGTATIRVVQAGRVVDTLGVFRFDGTLRRTYRWSPTLGGSRAVLQASVIAAGAKRKLALAVSVVADTGDPRFSATVSGQNRRPTVGKPWWWAVHARAGGRAAGGTAIVRVIVAGQVVDTVGWFGFDGAVGHSYRWSPKLRGAPALFQAKVIGPGGTRTVAYAVRVR
jgi:hypothetical protein